MIKVIVKQRYPVPVEVQPQNGIQVKAYQAGPPGAQGPPGEGAVIGPNQVAFGAPVTGVITGDDLIHVAPSFGGNPARGYFQSYGARIGNINGGVIQLHTDAVVGWTNLELQPSGSGYIGFYTASGSERATIDSSGVWKIYGGVVATDNAMRVDAVGVKFGPRSTMGSTNNYPFEVVHFNGTPRFYLGTDHTAIFSAFNFNGIGIHATHYLSETDIRMSHFGVGAQFTFSSHSGHSYIRHRMEYDVAYYANIYYGARNHFFTGAASIQAPNAPLSVFQDSTSATATGTFFKASNGDNTPVLRVNRGDGTTITPGPNIRSVISFGLSDGVGVFSGINDRVLLFAEYNSVWTPGNDSTLHTALAVETYRAGVRSEKFRITPYGVKFSNGANPPSPDDGEFWYNGTNLKFRNGSTTRNINTDEYVVNEIPSGLINGSNATFTTAFDFVPGTEEVFLNGIKLVKLEDYNTTGNNQIDLYVSPLTGEDLIINYSKI